MAAKLSAMQTRRWLNPTQPQTLQIAVFLLYINAVFNFLDVLSPRDDIFLALTFKDLVNLATLALVAAGVGGGYGIANERKWGYALGVAAAAIPLGCRVYVMMRYEVGLLDEPLGLMFDLALLVLLLHGQSRDYQRIWFK
jgi:hypothetical protein